MEDIPKNKLLIGKILDSTMCQLVNGQRPKKEAQELKLWSTPKIWSLVNKYESAPKFLV